MFGDVGVDKNTLNKTLRVEFKSKTKFFLWSGLMFLI